MVSESRLTVKVFNSPITFIVPKAPFPAIIRLEADVPTKLPSPVIPPFKVSVCPPIDKLSKGRSVPSSKVRLPFIVKSVFKLTVPAPLISRLFNSLPCKLKEVTAPPKLRFEVAPPTR